MTKKFHLGFFKRNFVCTGTQEKGAVTPQVTDPVLTIRVQKSSRKVRVNSDLLWVGVTAVHSSACMGPYEEVTIIFITSTIVWPQVKQQETQPCPSTENWIKDLLSMALPIRTRPSFPLSQSLPSGSFHKPLILLH